MPDRRELIEYARRRLWAVVEEEHNPEVDRKAMLRSQNNRRLVIGIVVGKVAQSRQHLGCLIRSEDVIAAPDLTDWVCLQGVCCDDAKVVAATLKRSEKVCVVLVKPRAALRGICLTGVLLRISINHRTIGQYNFKVHDIVGCPAVLSA